MGEDCSHGDRYALKGKNVVVWLEDGETIWEETSFRAEKRYDMENVEHVVINTDGTAWGRQGTNYFPNAHYQLSRYHLHKKLRETFNVRSKKIDAVLKLIQKKDKEALILKDTVAWALLKAILIKFWRAVIRSAG